MGQKKSEMWESDPGCSSVLETMRYFLFAIFKAMPVLKSLGLQKPCLKHDATHFPRYVDIQ